VFAIIAGLTHWFPLIFNLTLNPLWLKIQFFIIFLGVNITFFPQHFLGLNGIPRRYSDYPDMFTHWNIISSLGSLLSIIRIILFVFILWDGLVCNRLIIFNNSPNSSREWLNFIPSQNHTFNTRSLIINNI
jgi:cytochrome c oxidase subunit 1